MRTIADVAADLTVIDGLVERLREQAIGHAVTHPGGEDVPGGDAMVNLAPTARPSEWSEQYEAAENRHDADPRRFPEPDIGHEGTDDYGTALWTLWFWSDGWRTHHDQELGDRRATITTETNFIRWALNWAWDEEPAWDEFAADVRAVRSNLENLMHAGDRAERIRVVCPDCDAGRRLILKYGATPADDEWKCPACRHKFTEPEVTRAWAKQMRSQGAERWVPINDVISVMRGQGWRTDTVRGWLMEDVVTACELDGRRPVAWWPDVWHTHLSAKYRREQAAKKAADLRRRKQACAAEHGEDCWVRGRGCSQVQRLRAVS